MNKRPFPAAMIAPFALLLLLASAPPASCRLFRVPGDAAGVKEAVAAASAGDTVAVAEGIYKENLLIEKSLVLLGGWDAAFSEREPERRRTALDGRGVPESVIVIRGEGVRAELDGFTVRNGWVDGNGGGVLILNGAEGILRNNRIHDNYARYHGGGVCAAYGSSVIAEGNLFERNSVVFHGGGLCLLENSRGEIRGNVFRGNWVVFDSGAGAAALKRCRAEVNGNLFEANRAMKRGGAISFLQEVEGRVARNLVAGNDCGYMGGAIYSWKNDAVIERNTLLRNFSPLAGGVRIDSRGSARVEGNILVRCTGPWIFREGKAEIEPAGNVVLGCGAGEGTEPWAGARREDPLLCGEEEGDARLRPGSPCLGEKAAGCYDSTCGEGPFGGEPPLPGGAR